MIEISQFDSRPAYGRLAPDPRARTHLIAAEDEGAGAVLDTFADANGARARTILLYAEADRAGDRHSKQLACLGWGAFLPATSRGDLLSSLDGVLATATMGTRLYAAGSESFIGEVIARAAGFGVVPQSVIAEKRGSPARRVQCVHCKHVAEAVTVSPYTCPGCGQSLMVRDHFSRRLSAFQGVRIDAEEPGEIPPVQELSR
ncbi:dimethylamine monooxygenase subunit DmmA family protein [Methylorubrum extorquens]|jgi:dimethylamine monooxygenase subunit C|uniref:dimethylamine monooxygenase subunit DmmA family protein n=1 Tax=Methylorubrum extorquens TaxID=408 RepID=UPI001EE57A03|nr:dimethylamine monooxygenase subunit DmmA family protein [Methylorubrum extorquens]MCG5249354.1 hypothetical protein [Methylorubrum extorquens]